MAIIVLVFRAYHSTIQAIESNWYDIPIYPRHIQTLNVPAQLVFFVDTVMDSLALNETLVPTLDRGLNRQLVWFRKGVRCTQQSMLQAASMTAKHHWIQFDSYRTKYWIYTLHWVRFESVDIYIYKLYKLRKNKSPSLILPVNICSSLLFVVTVWPCVGPCWSRCFLQFFWPSGNRSEASEASL